MNTDLFFSYIMNPALITESNNKELDAVIKEYPYFETLYLLQAKAAHNNKSIHYALKLKTASVYASDRIRLYELLSESNTNKAITVKTENKEKIKEDKNTSTTVVTKEEITIFEQETLTKKKELNIEEKQEEIIKTNLENSNTATYNAQKSASLKEDVKENINYNTSDKKETDTKTEKQKESTVLAKEVENTTINTLQKITLAPVLKEEKKEVYTATGLVNLSEQVSKILPIKELPDKTDLDKELESKISITEVSPIIEKLSEKKEILDNVEKEVLAEVLNQHVVKEIKQTEPQTTANISIKKSDENIHLKEASNTSHSFIEWLKLAQQNKEYNSSNEKSNLIEQSKAINPKANLQKKVAQLNLIERFIEKEPKITSPKKVEFFNPINKAKESAEEDFSFVTETLAKIYLQQGNNSKALKSYEHLSLKFPEKSAYFASQIEKIKEQLKK